RSIRGQRLFVTAANGLLSKPIPNTSSQMSHDSTPHLARRKCANCGLVNAAADEGCRRCGAVLTDEAPLAARPIDTEAARKPANRGLVKRLIWIVSATFISLMVWYFSLLASSDGLSPDQHLKIDVAIARLEPRGFSREAFVLRHLTNFRSTDNW